MSEKSRAAGHTAGSANRAQSIYDFPVRDARGRERTLADYRGDVLLIVNTASY